MENSKTAVMLYTKLVFRPKSCVLHCSKTYQMLHIFYCICFCIYIRFRKFFTELKAPTKTQSFFKISSAFKHYSWAAELKGPSTTWITHKTIYCTGTIISRGLYNLYPIFHCGLYCRAVYIAERLVLPWFFFHLKSPQKK